MTRSGVEPRFLRVDLCFELRLGLVTYWGRLGRWFLVCLRSSVRFAQFDSREMQVGCLYL